MKIVSKFLVLITIVSLITACATTKPMSAQDRQAIHTVTVDSTVKTPSEIYYMGPGSPMLGAIVGGIVDRHNAHKFERCINANNIHIEQIVRAQLISQLKYTELKFVSQPPADADLVINIKIYGFSIPNGFSMYVIPILNVEVDMMRNNQVAWSSNYLVGPLSNKMLPKYHQDDLLSNPKLITEAWNLAAQKAVEHILNNLQASS